MNSDSAMQSSHTLLTVAHMPYMMCIVEVHRRAKMAQKIVYTLISDNTENKYETSLRSKQNVINSLRRPERLARLASIGSG